MHPARTLPAGEVRLAGGVTANVALGALGDELRTAKDVASRDPQAPGAPGSNPAYAKGALVAAAAAPGLAPFIGARVGVGDAFEGGLAYTGRALRADMRRSFDKEKWSLSVGLGLTAALYGVRSGSGAALPNVDLGSLHGYGFDVPVLVGWESDGGLYKVWGGARGGFERDVVEKLSTEPRAASLGGDPLRLDADRFWAGAVAGVAAGFNHIHVALELALAYQVIHGTYNANTATVQGLSLAPSTALWWTF